MSDRTRELSLRVAFGLGVLLSVVFLVVSVITWSLPLGACALVLAILLTKNLDVIGVDVDRRKGTSA